MKEQWHPSAVRSSWWEQEGRLQLDSHKRMDVPWFPVTALLMPVPEVTQIWWGC